MRKITANSIGLEAGAAGALLTGREKRDNVFEGMPLALSRCGAVSKPAGAMPLKLFTVAASSPNPRSAMLEAGEFNKDAASVPR